MAWQSTLTDVTKAERR